MIKKTDENKEMNNQISNEQKEILAGVIGEKQDEAPIEEEKNKTEDVKEDSNIIKVGEYDIAVIAPKEFTLKRSTTEFGNLSHVKYYSTTCEKERYMNVLLPANYSKEKKYPVMYVLHGIFGDENSMCGSATGGIPLLAANMMGKKEAKEMILVFPHMYASKDKEQCSAIDIENVLPYDNFINELVNDIMPYMAENYSILEGKENTAVTGFSMGGRESLAIGLKRPDLFGYIGSISPAPGLVPGQDWAMYHPGTFQEEEVVYNDEKPIFIMLCSGDKDSVVGTFPMTYHELYDRNEIQHIWWIIPGSDHGDPAISSGMYNFMKYIFK